MASRRQVARGDSFKLKHLISLLWSCRIHHLSAWCFSCVRLEFQVCVDRLWGWALTALDLYFGRRRDHAWWYSRRTSKVTERRKKLQREPIQFVIGTFNVIPSSMRNWKGGHRAKKAQALLRLHIILFKFGQKEAKQWDIKAAINCLARATLFAAEATFFGGERSMLAVPHFVQSRFCLFCGWGAAWNVKVVVLLG